MRIEHTEITLTLAEAFPTERDLWGAASEKASALPRQCPTCGSPWLSNLHDELASLRLTAAQLQLAASQGKLHLFCAPSNEVWVCERSIQQMKENCSLPTFLRAPQEG